MRFGAWFRIVTGYDWSKRTRELLEAGIAAREAQAMTVGTWWAVFIQPGETTRTPTDAATIQERINRLRAAKGLPPAKPNPLARG